jgi:ABC-type spermidine/putrescine transport system permease subunit I
MSTSLWTQVVGGVAGAALAFFGASMLITGRAPRATARAFRSIRDAGFYHLLFGVGLVLVVLGTSLDNAVVTTTVTVLAVLMVGVALVRFRPRAPRREHHVTK